MAVGKKERRLLGIAWDAQRVRGNTGIGWQEGVIFFFKQKTAYEIYQCDWSSDVCSSDLIFIIPKDSDWV